MSASASIGPISGINYGQLITGLTALDQVPITNLQNQVATIGSENTAFVSLSAMMAQLQISAGSLTTATVFKSSTANSSNSNVATATAGPGTAVGSYQFNVERLATSSQLVTQGYADSTSTAVGQNTTLTFQFGKGQLNQVQNLSALNGGAGVQPGSIRITDSSGNSAIINLSQAVDVNDVVNAINSASGVNVVAKVSGDRFVLTDSAGGSGTLSVANVGGDTTASSLGLTNAAVNGTITGSDVNQLTATTNLNTLNNGSGVRTAGLLPDFSITSSGGTFNVSLSGDNTLGDVIKSINNAGGNTTVKASISANGHGITLTDSGGTLSLNSLNNSMALYDLGLSGAPSGGTLTGGRINSDLTSPLLTQLNGGYEGGSETPLTTGQISINGQTIDLSGANTVNDVIKQINTNTQGVTASLDNSGTGITLTSSTGPFTVADVTGNTAKFLHLAGSSTSTSSGNTIASGNLDLRAVSENTPLSTLNAGAGFTPGSFTVTDGTGASYTVNLTSPSITTLGQVISQINSATNGIRAQINSTGTGIELYDTSGGTGTPTLQESPGGTTAASLGLTAGAFTSGVLNGTFTKSVQISSTDTLSSIANKINLAGIGVAASVINDGSGSTPYRLSLVSRSSGSAGQLIFGAGSTSLTTTAVTQGQDAVVVYGSGAGLQYTSSTNNLNNIVPGLNVTLGSTGSTTIAVSRDTSQVAGAVQTFVTNYNNIITNIASLTNFDASDPTQNGILFGNATVQSIQNALGSFITRNYSNVGAYTNIAQLGISVNQDGTLTLNTDTLNAALASNPADVTSFFTTNNPAVAPAAATATTPATAGSPALYGFGQSLINVLTTFTDPQDGTIYNAENALQTQVTQLNQQIANLNTLLTDKKNTLIQTFANLEVTISQLQSQGSAISKLSSTTTTG